jgi:hypothetical protein
MPQKKNRNVHSHDAVPIVFRPLLEPRASPSSFSLSYIPDPDLCAVRSTIDVPSRNRARNSTFAFVNKPSLRETTMNWEPLKRVRKSWPMCCVCERSRAASISSRMYIGAGLNWRRAMMRESAIRDLCDNIRMQDGLVFFFFGRYHDGMEVSLTVDHRSVPSSFASKRSRVGL